MEFPDPWDVADAMGAPSKEEYLQEQDSDRRMDEGELNKMGSCSIEYCEHAEYTEGVCLWHYPLWESWGYAGGYEVYHTKGQEEGRKQFKKWLMQLRHQYIIDILTHYDWKLTQAVNESIDSDSLRKDDTPKKSKNDEEADFCDGCEFPCVDKTKCPYKKPARGIPIEPPL